MRSCHACLMHGKVSRLSLFKLFRRIKQVCFFFFFFSLFPHLKSTTLEEGRDGEWDSAASRNLRIHLSLSSQAV